MRSWSVYVETGAHPPGPIRRPPAFLRRRDRPEESSVLDVMVDALEEDDRTLACSVASAVEGLSVFLTIEAPSAFHARSSAEDVVARALARTALTGHPAARLVFDDEGRSVG